ncbi:MAG: dihydroorotase [Pseudomonadota bacterium]
MSQSSALSYLIKNAQVVNEGKIFSGDCLIQDGRIARIESSISSVKVDKEIDAKGLFLIPGMIDDQVHFREPGFPLKADFASESRAAVAGGVTSFMEMPNTAPATTNRHALRDKYKRAANRSWGNYAFYFGATEHNLEEIKNLDREACAGLKVFMGASTGNLLVQNPVALEKIFQHSPVLIVTHCEDSPTIERNQKSLQEELKRPLQIQDHPHIRSAEACYASSSLAVGLAKKFDARLHVLHLTTEKELALFTQAKSKRITAEVCVHHLTFTSDDYASLGNLIKCNPAIKFPSDRAALRKAVNSGLLDVIATDHAPHTWQEKRLPFEQAPAGLPLVQHVLLALFELVLDGEFTLPLVVEKTSHAVANLYGIEKRGYLREGYWADLALVDLIGSPQPAQPPAYRCGWSPFLQKQFRSKIVGTWVNGQLAHYADEWIGQPQGQPLGCQAMREKTYKVN